MTKLLPLTLAFALACGSDVRSSPDPTPEPPAPPPPNPALQAHMGEHFTAGQAALQGLVHGDREATRAALKQLAEHPTAEGLPPGTQQHVDAMKAAAARGAASEAASEEARALADVALACGTCHQAAHAKLTFEVEPAPGREPGASGHKSRYAWAVDRMWEGLVGPTESSWSQVAAVLNDQPMASALVAPDKRLSPETEASAKRLQELGSEGLDAPNPAVRTRVFAEALTACESCHEEAGVTW